ncbi:MAG: WG repeat-containing protein [Prevotellaceae bacterium]|nr:WG repeat-containing protein [Prevotellaceae bacterium]
MAAGFEKGYINTLGKKIISIRHDASSGKYDGFERFSEGLARVSLNGKYGYIDKTGKRVIPLKYQEAGDFHEGLALVKLDGKCGYIDKAGNAVVPFKYDKVRDNYDRLLGDFHEGLACVSLDGKYGYVDKTGGEVIPLKYRYGHDFSEGMAAVNLDGKCGYIDKTGGEVIPFKYDYADNFSEGLAMVKSDGKCGYIDKTGNEAIKLKYSYFTGTKFSKGKAWIKVGDEGFFIDKAGTELYGNRQEQILCESPLASCFKQLDDYCSTINKSSGGSASFTIDRPYLALRVDHSLSVANNKCRHIRRLRVASKIERTVFSEQSVNTYKTLVIAYRYLDDTGLYNRVGSAQNLNVESYGVYLVYFDVEKKEIIGHDVIRGRNLPEKMADTGTFFQIDDYEIMNKIESHLATMKGK